MNSRSKGKRGELEAVRELKARGVGARRTAQNGVDGAADLETDLGLVEVKRRKHVALLYEALGQSEARILMLRADGRDWLVVQRLDDFLGWRRDRLGSTRHG